VIAFAADREWNGSFGRMRLVRAAKLGEAKNGDLVPPIFLLLVCRNQRLIVGIDDVNSQ
jgi:hypothetical protein